MLTVSRRINKMPVILQFLGSAFRNIGDSYLTSRKVFPIHLH